jgi:hypothetical protein
MRPFTFDPHSPRIQLAHHRLRDAYARTPGAAVPIVEPGGYRRAYTTQELLADYALMADHAVQWAIVLAATDNDWPPFLDTYVGVCTIAEAFGCKVVWTPGNDPWTEPAVASLDDVWQLQPVPLGESYLVQRLHGWIDYAQCHLGTDVPFWTMDVQSPFSVAAHIVEPTELMLGCLTDPPAVHHLCQMITDYSIAMMEAHLAQMEHPGFPGRNFPSIDTPIGICIADDTPLVMLSPELYREFALPYNNQLSRAFGGVHIHCCGNYAHNLDNLLAMEGIRSVQLHAGPGEFPLPTTAAADCAFNRARGQVTLLVDSNPVSHGDRFRDRPQDCYADYILPALRQAPLTGLILQSCGPGQDLPDTAAALAWTRGQCDAGDVGSDSAN